LGQINFAHPEMELYNPAKLQEKDKWVPFYSSTEKLKKNGLDTKGIQRIIQKILPIVLPEFEENLPPHLLEKYKLPLRQHSVFQLHNPSNEYFLQRSQARLKFEELFYMQLQFQQNIQHRKEKIEGIVMQDDGEMKAFIQSALPFELTQAQQRVLEEIQQDLKSGFQMSRLLQGDVGSGKTIVAFLCTLLAKNNACQSAMMAPTEILAKQHYESILSLAKSAGMRIALLTGSTPASDRKHLLYLLKEGEIDLLIGTHALIEDPVQFKNLGLCVIDEQHRFGVEQRAKLQRKGLKNPHILVMTATPIPRTLALTVYGDLDTSIIDELPKGRLPIKTIHRRDSQRATLYDYIRKEIAQGRQVYVVFPLIEESEKLDLKDLMDGYNTWNEVFPQPEFEISMVHGRMKSDQKEAEMKRFVEGKAQIMVATTVIEVGVNVPNASIMVIENAERFGLSQLHQLRGRVGRGQYQSYCILMSRDDLGADSRKRIQTMVETTDGFVISEVDLQLRGPGDLLGTRQSGMLDLKIANLMKDQKIVIEARKVAEDILLNDPNLAQPQHLLIKQWMEKLQRKKNYFSVA
jgi:ATP-dependent DNA helicase RecG